MARRKKAVTGLVNELSAQLDFAKDPNILVFTPLGGLGPIDIVTLNMTTGEYTAYDVKTKNFRKKDYIPSDEFRIYTDDQNQIEYIEYWYMDWFDGASIRVNDDVIYHICEMFLECSEKQDPCDIWKLEELEEDGVYA